MDESFSEANSGSSMDPFASPFSSPLGWLNPASPLYLLNSTSSSEAPRPPHHNSNHSGLSGWTGVIGSLAGVIISLSVLVAVVKREQDMAPHLKQVDNIPANLKTDANKPELRNAFLQKVISKNPDEFKDFAVKWHKENPSKTTHPSPQPAR